MEQSSAYVLILIGVGGFLVDLVLKPISSAGLVLLLLAATPSLVALFKRERSPADSPHDTAKAPQAPAIPLRAPAPRAPTPDRPKAAPTAAPTHAREVSPERMAPARERASSESRSPEPAGQAAAARVSSTPQPQPDQQRLPLPARGLRPADAEPQRQRADASVSPSRRLGEPQRIHPNGL